MIPNITKSSKTPVRNHQHLQVWLCSWWTSIHARELEIGVQLKNDILLWSMVSNFTPEKTQSSRSPVRNYQHPPSIAVLLMKTRMTYNVIHDVKFDTKDDSILQISSQELSMSSKYDCVLDALIIMLGS